MTLPNLQEILTMTLGPMPWLVGSLILLGFNLMIPNPTTVALGLAGLITALVSISIPLFPSQLLIWGVTAAAFTLVLRSFVPQESRELAPSRFARVHETIPAGGVGRVHYEGAIWHARCQISDVAIAPESLVTVVNRQGNTLIVMPMPTFPSTSR